MNNIFGRLVKKKSEENHPNSNYFFFQILNDFSPIPFFYWWANIIFVVIYCMAINVFDLNIKITNLTKNNHFSKTYCSINDGFTVFIISVILLFTYLIFFKSLRDGTKHQILKGIKWSRNGKNNLTSDELVKLKKIIKFFLLFVYLVIPFLLFRDLPLKKFWQNLISSNIGNLLFLEIIYISVLQIFTAYLISKEI